MNKSSVIHARIEPGTKADAEGILRELGLSPADAIRLFYKQICLSRGLPFQVVIPNKVTRRTLEKSSRGEDVQTFKKIDEMFASWEK